MTKIVFDSEVRLPVIPNHLKFQAPSALLRQRCKQFNRPIKGIYKVATTARKLRIRALCTKSAHLNSGGPQQAPRGDLVEVEMPVYLRVCRKGFAELVFAFLWSFISITWIHDFLGFTILLKSQSPSYAIEISAAAFTTSTSTSSGSRT